MNDVLGDDVLKIGKVKASSKGQATTASRFRFAEQLV